MSNISYIDRTLDKDLFVKRLKHYLKCEVMDKAGDKSKQAKIFCNEIINEVTKRLESQQLAPSPFDLTYSMLDVIEAKNHIDIKNNGYMIRLYKEDVLTLKKYLNGEI